MASKNCVKDACPRVPVHHSLPRLSFEEVEATFFNTYGRFVRGPVDKQSRAWRPVPAGTSLRGPFGLPRMTVAVDPPGWRPPAQTNPYAVKLMPRKEWNRKYGDAAGFWDPAAAGNPGITMPDDETPDTMVHEIIHAWTAYKWWRYVAQGPSVVPEHNEEDVRAGVLPKPRWSHMAGWAMTEALTELLTGEAGFPSDAYAEGVQYIRQFGIARDVWAAALFGGEIKPLEQALQAASGGTVASVFVECAMRLGGRFISEVNPQDRR